MIFLLLFLHIIFGNAATAQSFKLTGKLADSETKETLPGVYVTLKNIRDTAAITVVVSDKSGQFTFSNLDSKTKFVLTASYLGYVELRVPVQSKSGMIDLGMLLMTPKTQQIGEVLIKRDPPAATQKGDTTEMNAGALKVNRDATAEDLIKKMPGVTSENGTLKAHGEEVKKVLVDGKAFFGDDPSIALKNLPAEVIEKVQVFNKLSEQSELTGFDDGQSAKTINIITKQNRRNGLFGKAVGGTDFNKKYLAGGSINRFKDQQRISVIGLANNVNQQNFGSQDLISSSGGNGRNFAVSQQQGITTTGSVGLNYSNGWGKKASLTSSYFFNDAKNELDQALTQNKFITAESNMFYNETSYSMSRNNNHRINMRLELNPDTMNTIIITPRLSFQSNNASNFTYGRNTNNRGYFENSSWNKNHTNSTGNNLGSEIVYRHKFKKVRRTFSVGINGGSTLRDSENYKLFYEKHAHPDSLFSLPDSLPINQYADGAFQTFSLSSNLVYTEPVGKYGLVQLNYNASFSSNKSDKRVFSVSDSGALTNQIDILTNVYQNNYISNRIGTAYRFKMKQMNFSLGMDYQRADLNGKLDYPVVGKVSKVFENVLPNMFFMYRSGNQSNIRFVYRASTNAPSITQLQKVIDNSNSLSLTTGNPELKQEYSHNITTHFMLAKPENSTSISVFLTGMTTKDPIGSQTITALKDTLLAGEGVILKQGSQLTRPINLTDPSWSVRSMVNYSFPVKIIKSKLNLILGLNYTVSPGYINMFLNTSKTTSLTSGLVLSSNISENADFSISYTSTNSFVRNDIAIRNNTTFWYQTAGAKINFIIGNGFVLQSDVVGQFNSGLAQSFNENYVIWNAGLGKKFLKSKNAELKVYIYDVLNQSRNISRTVTPQYIQDLRYNALRQYAMLTFTYTLRNFSGGDAGNERMHGDRPWMGDHPPMGDRPGRGDRGTRD